MKKKYSVIIYNIVVVLIVFGALEYYFEYKLSHPESLSGRVKIASQNYYMKYGRKIIQYEPEMATYDKNVFYKLKPGTFQFKNREFDVNFQVNSLGVRDDEASLQYPQIAILGDSHAMGWGVAQHETFEALLEKSTAKKTLNTAISSYGTARECTLLQQTKRDSLQYIIIQYCDNDYQENHAFYDNGNSLKISSKEIYDNVSEDQRKKGNYYLFKHTLKFIGLLFKANTAENTKYKAPEDEIEVFLNVIKETNIIKNDVKLIVLNINGRKTSPDFIHRLTLTLQENKWQDLAKNIIPLDVSVGLTPDMYHILDDHLNAKGHAYVANELEKLIKR